MNTLPSTEDRIWAIVSHLSALALGMGIVLPIVGWAEQRRRSNYAAFQTLQALGYQTLGFSVWALSSLLIVVVAVLLLFALGDGSQGGNPFPPAWSYGIFIAISGLFAVYSVLPVIAAVACGLGREFRYPLMGGRLARYLGYGSAEPSAGTVWLNEEHEFRWVAAMGHFSILILFWGMLAPLTAWILPGKHSLFLRFQSIQTLVFQAATTALYFVALFLYAVSFFLLITALGAFGTFDLDSAAGIVGILVLGGTLLFSFVLILSIPLLHILGQWAGYRLLKGEDYRYPLIGRWVDKWSSTHPILEEN
jgi:uncharacterized Tic20 family protein